MFRLRTMQIDELSAVNQLGVRAKATWNYTAAQMAVFTEELTHGPDLLANSLTTRVAAEDTHRIVGSPPSR